MRKKIIFLCSISEETRERLGYANALRYLGYEVLFAKNEIDLVNLLNQISDQVFCIIHPNPNFSFHSLNIWEHNIPNIIFQFDTYTLVNERINASKPYDIQVVCHAGYEQLYKKNGCDNVITLPHCIDDLMLGKIDHPINDFKKYDIGWVGRFDGSFYKFRRQVLNVLESSNLKINNPRANYSWEEMFTIFLESKIVVNASRDDFECDANLRCFEAMGSGSLLLTKLPTELSEFGYIDGEHFVGYESLVDLKEKLDYYIANNTERDRIANNGKKMTLDSHTFIQRAKTLISYIQEHSILAINNNSFRLLPLKDKCCKIYYSHYKDGNLKQIIHSFLKCSFLNQIMLFSKTVNISLRIIKRRLFN